MQCLYVSVRSALRLAEHKELVCMCVEGAVLVRPSFHQYSIRLMILQTDYRLSLNCRESVFPTLGDKLLNEIKSVTCQVLIVQAGNPCTLEARELPVKARLGSTEHPWPMQATCYV